MINNRILIVSIGAIALDLFIILSFYSFLPNQIPSHFDGYLNPTDYSEKKKSFLHNGLFIYLL